MYDESLLRSYVLYYCKSKCCIHVIYSISNNLYVYKIFVNIYEFNT